MLRDAVIDPGPNLTRMARAHLLKIAARIFVIREFDQQHATTEKGFNVLPVPLQDLVVITQRAFIIAFAFACDATIEIRMIERWIRRNSKGEILNRALDLALFQPLIPAFER